MNYISYYNSKLGSIMLSSDGEMMTGLLFEGQKYHAACLSAERKEQQLFIFKETKNGWIYILKVNALILLPLLG